MSAVVVKAESFELMCVESTTGAVAVVSRWVVSSAFALPPQSGLTWPRFLSPLIEPGVRISRTGLSDNDSCFRPRKVARSYTQPGESQCFVEVLVGES